MKNLFTFLLGICLLFSSCQEEFDFQENPSFTNIEDGLSNPLSLGTVITTSGNKFYHGQTIQGFDNCIPNLESADKDDRSGYNADCSTHPGGNSLLLYQNGLFVDAWDAPSSFNTNGYSGPIGQKQLDFSWTIPSDIPAGTGYQIAIVQYGCYGASMPSRSPYYCDLSDMFEIDDQKCGIEITLTKPYYELGENAAWFRSIISDGPSMIYGFSHYKDGSYRGSVTFDLLSPPHNYSLGELHTVMGTVGYYYNQSDLGTYTYVFTLDCGNGRSVEQTVSYEVRESGGSSSPPGFEN